MAQSFDHRIVPERLVALLRRCQTRVPFHLGAADLVHDPVPDVELPPAPSNGVVIKSLADLRANKLTCILSRSEPRDLVDVLFLDRAGFPPELDTPLALSKDAGIDPSHCR